MISGLGNYLGAHIQRLVPRRIAHTFTRPGGWSWDVALHYVGEMGEGMIGRRLFDLITEGRVKWDPLPDVYDVFVYPNLQVRACKGEANLRSALTRGFALVRRICGIFYGCR